ncbi:glycosyltransferase [Candidatus Gracilibacteria bacterium]|nr:glycosyltransferase [Candidatus Gracilibacteria bacterium]
MDQKKSTIALTGGSTGGHIFPLLAVHNYIKEENNNTEFVWVGEAYSLEEEVAEKARIPFVSIAAGKLRRYFDIRNFYEPLKNLTGICEGIYYIRKYNIDTVFSKGGYVALPLCIAAWIMRKKIYIHESDTISGVANKIIGKIASKVWYSFPNEFTQGGNTKYAHIGQILNPELIDQLESLEIEEKERLQVIVLGGSQGSSRILSALATIIPDLLDIDFQIVLGEKNMHLRDDFKKFPNTLVHDFLTQRRLGKILKDTDIAVTRGGATSLAELNVFGIHSIIVPLTESAGNHQSKNALYYKESFGSNVLDENKDLDLELFRLLKNFQDLRKQGLNLDSFFSPLHTIKTELFHHQK